MTTIPEIASHENITEHYLRLNIETNDLPCGSIDFVSEKINFNICGRCLFKGMVAIKDIQLEYKDGKLIFIFKNKKNLRFNCSLKEFETVSTHIRTYGYHP
ncbi:hypothetical protein SAMN04488524_0007 [Pedobacter africanus]|uniref:Uncharacterized protein n=1 Tax=Pedobacter africanus TaxID=151894 RepID=A0A1W1YLF1_9SPHI|nr:hypothetical protein SAMN04488524_0007 [Pedobacter africanus]